MIENILFQINTIEPPFGKCSKTSETLSMCKMKCRIKYIFNECGCIDTSMLSMNFTLGTKCQITQTYMSVQQSVNKTMYVCVVVVCVCVCVCVWGVYCSSVIIVSLITAFMWPVIYCNIFHSIYLTV